MSLEPFYKYCNFLEVSEKSRISRNHRHLIERKKTFKLIWKTFSATFFKMFSYVSASKDKKMAGTDQTQKIVSCFDPKEEEKETKN